MEEGAHLGKDIIGMEDVFFPLLPQALGLELVFQNCEVFSYPVSLDSHHFLDTGFCFVLITIIRCFLAQEIKPLRISVPPFIASITAWCLLMLF